MAKGKGKNHTDYESVKYEKLQQNENEEEDDDVMFSQEGIASKVYNHEDVVVDGNHIQLEKATLVRNPDSSVVHFKKSGLFRGTRNFCFIAIIVFCIVAALFFGLVLPKLRSSVVTGGQQQGTPSWEKNFFNYTTESCVRLYDVDNDGKDDVILGLALGEVILNIMHKTHQETKDYCRELGEGDYCVGRVMALRGSDGKLLWHFQTLGVVFEINCGHIDIDLDGQSDCVGTGRFATVVAFNPRNGTVYWRIDDSRVHESWNTYNVLIVPDVTGDGVKDIILPHGGDPKIPPEVHVRSPGELLLLDGASGKILGQSLEMKDSQGDKETYMSPVLHSTKDGSLYILYGSGGETVGGSFYAISLPDFYHYITRKKVLPNLAGPGSYQQWGSKQKSEDGIIEIYKSTTKGVMVPPVLLDTTGDGVKDILMLAYDGITTLYNGETLKAIWTANFSGYETYSTPAPGHFTDDDTLDFMLHLSSGYWPDYNHSLTIVLDGTNGQIVWSVNTTRYEMSSDLVAMTTEPHQDLFVFRIQGRPELSGNGHSEDVSKRKKRSADGSTREGASPFQRRQSQPAGGMDNLPDYRGQPGYKSQSPPGYQSPDKDDYSDNYEDNRGGRYNYQYRDQVTESMYDFPDSDELQEGGDDGGWPGRKPKLDYLGHPVYGNDDTENDMNGGQPGRGGDGQQHPGHVVPNFECRDGEPEHTTEVYVVDRTTLRKPIRIYTLGPEKVYYNMTDADRDMVKAVDERHKQEDMLHQGSTGNQGGRSRRHGIDDSDTPMQVHPGQSTDSGPLCMLLKPSEKTTGALGDLDGDGELDLVLLFDMGGGKHDELGNYFNHKANTRIVKLNLKEYIESGEAVDLHPQVADWLKHTGTNINKLKFRKKEEQSWTAYLGSKGDSTLHTVT